MSIFTFLNKTIFNHIAGRGVNKIIAFLISFAVACLGTAFGQAPSISYPAQLTAYIGKPLAPVTVSNSGGAIPNKLYPQNIFLNSNASLSSPRDLTRTSNGDIFVILDVQIYRFRPDGTFSVFAGTTSYGSIDGTGTAAGFQQINGIDKDASDNLYVTESNAQDGANCKIRKITPAGVVTTVVTGLNAPNGIAVAGNGVMYVSEYSGKIMKIAANGSATLLAGQAAIGKADGVGANASFYNPGALAIDQAGNVYVNDSGNSLIRKIAPDGTVSTFAGSTTGYADGTGTAAKFYLPTDIVFDTKGNLIVADGNGLIRKISPSAVVTTIAQPAYYDDQNRPESYYYPNRIVLDNLDNIISYTSAGVYNVFTTGYAISPALPAGLVFGTDGSISGTPTALSASQAYTIRAQNSGGVSTTTINLGVTIPPDPPVITSFTPTSSYQNGYVTITGNYFTGATAVTIGGKAASSFTVLSPTSISAYVAVGAASGDVTVTSPNGTATLSGFTFIPPPVISSFTPTSGGNGTVITINGTGFTGINQVQIGGYAPLSYSVISPTQIQATVGGSGGSGSISVNATNGAASLAGFTYVNAPVISSISPSSGGAGATITINGSNFSNASSVKFGTVPATSFAVVSATQITAVVAAGSANGLTVTTPGGPAVYSGFSFISPPVITQASPLKGGQGSSIFISGSNLTGAQVTIGGVPAAVSLNSSIQIIATVGSGASSGNIVVTTAGGSATLPGFTWVPAPSVSSFSPQTAKIGDQVTISGTNLSDVTSVSFGGVPATFTIVSSTSIQATIGYGASGSVSVTSPGGTAGLPGFVHTGPSITSFSPTQAGAGQTVIIQGSNFTGVTDVAFGGVPATSFVINSPAQITAVVGSGKTGSVTVVSQQGTGVLGGFVHPGPSITSFSPLYAGPLSTAPVTISGTNLTGTTSVTFGGIPAASFTVVSAGTVTAIPSNASSGDVVVTTTLGSDKKSGFTWVLPPTISSISPASQKSGGTVTISGTNFTGVTSVSFGGVAAQAFSAISPTTISAVVGSGASGSVSVATVGGTVSLPGFSYSSPVIQSVSPLTAAAGQTVTLTGINLDAVQTVQFGGTNAASFTILSPTSIAAVVGTGSSGNVTVSGTAGASTYAGFTFVQPPLVYSITPTQGGAGTLISINGSNLATVTTLQIGGVPATITSIADNLVKATVGSGATGKVSLTTIAGNTQFDGFTWFPAPTITSANPLTASAQTTVTITGTNFTGVTQVQFGTSFTNFTVVSPTQITAQPLNGTSGSITVTGPGGSAVLPGFVFIQAPVISGFTVTGGGQNAVVTISGSNFSNASSVQFGGVAAQSYTVNSSNSITAIVGAGATGSITVVTPGGTGSFAGFLYQRPPLITAFSPSSGPAGTTLTLTGDNFSTTAANNIVYFGPVKATVINATQTQLQVTVPTSANGLITVLNTEKGLFASSNLPFMVTNSSGFTGFSNKFSLPDFGSDFVIHDFDGDGQPDLLMAKGDTLFLLRHGADPVLSRSSFSKKIVLETGRVPVSLAVGDLDGDGKTDIVYSMGSSLVVLRNTSANGNISFEQTVLTNINNIYDTMVLRDMDMDGLPDLVVASGNVYLNTTKGSVISFGSSTFLANTSSSSNISFGLTDIDGDNKPDPVMGSSYTGISIFQNNSVPGSLTAALFPLTYILHSGYYYTTRTIVTADFDGDKKPDIVENDFSASQFLVSRNTAVKGSISNSSLATAAAFSNTSMFNGMTAADIDGDGKPDLVGWSNTDVYYARNTSTLGNIAFSNPAPVKTGASAGNVQKVSVADMDGDGRMDLVVLDGSTKSLVIYNNGPAAVPTISAVDPLAAGTGATITITGKYLDATTAVSFGTKAAASFRVVSPDTVIAVVGTGESGSISLQNPDGPATFPGFTFVLPGQATLVSSFTPLTATNGTTVTITGSNFGGATAVKFGGIAARSFTVVSPTTITAVVAVGASGSVSVTGPGGTGTLAGFSFIPIPANNYIIAINSATCRGSANGTISITAAQNLNYTATITGGSVNVTYPFTTTTTINNLAAGTYNICFTVAGQTGYSQCFTVVISEPKDLAVYTAVNKTINSVTLTLDGGNSYNVTLNGKTITTTSGNITLALNKGVNDLSVTTDKPCQGTVQKQISVSDDLTAYPNPFTSVLNVNLGDTPVMVEIYSLSGTKVYSRQFAGQSGTVQLDLSALKPAMYLLKIGSASAEKIYKIVKQ